MNRRTWRLVTGAVAVLGGLVVLGISWRVFPYHSLNHDEGVYLQQAAMLLEGKLFLRPPLEDAFRPWFFVEDGDRLYPKYAPVPAAIFALGKLLGGYRLALAGVAAGNLALVAAIGREVADRTTGLLAAVFVLCSPLFLLDSAVFLPYAPTTLLNLAFAYAYLRADGDDDHRFAAVAGVAIGLAFFARPYTAVLFAAPFVGHALWTLRQDWRATLPRQATTAVLGLGGVALTLGYNAVVTGSPWLFPYQAFAPLDGLGFGQRRILNHAVTYTPELALRANAKVVELFVTEWIAGGLLGAGLALAGFGVTVRRGMDARQATLAGVFGTVVVGNVYFWGNFNILGDIDRAGDGLVSVLGTYYHFDLLLPTAVFAAVGALAVVRYLRGRLRRRFDAGRARAVLAAVLVVSTSAFGLATAVHVDDHLEDNLEATETYRTAYEPFEGGAPRDAVVLLPDPYGDWLNHPFQPLRNDPGFDGATLYALDDRPLVVANAFPDRRLYRYVYRGSWAPFAGSPRAARLRRVRDVAGSRVEFRATVGIPDGAIGITARVGTDDGSVYAVVRNASEQVTVTLTITDGQVRLGGAGVAVGNRTLGVSGREDVRLTLFVDYGLAGGFTYRFDLPVNASDSRVRALSPRIERCRNARACGGAAAYVPETAPEGVFVRTSLVARERNP